MSLRHRLRTSLAAAALLAFACQPNKDQPQADAKPAVPAPKDATTPTTPTTPTGEPAPAGDGAIITLLDPGAEPREPLRLQLSAGQAQNMTMTMRMGMEMAMGPNKMPKTSIPPMQMVMSLSVKEITPEGDIKSEFSLDKIDVLPDPSAMPGVVDQLKSMLGTMQKISGTSTITPRGIVKSADFQLPDDLNPQIKQTMDGMRQQVNQMSVPFPEEALGIGAKWTVRQNLEQQGMKLSQTATWELKERSGTVVKLASTIVQEAAPQNVSAPGMPPGASVRLESLNSSGSGTTDVDLAKVAPIKGTMSMTSSVTMTTEANGVKMPMSMNMDLGLEIAGQ